MTQILPIKFQEHLQVKIILKIIKKDDGPLPAGHCPIWPLLCHPALKPAVSLTVTFLAFVSLVNYAMVFVSFFCFIIRVLDVGKSRPSGFFFPTQKNAPFLFSICQQYTQCYDCGDLAKIPPLGHDTSFSIS